MEALLCGGERLGRPGIRGKVAPPSEYLWLSLSLILGRDKTVAFTTSTLPLDQLTSRILIRKVIFSTVLELKNILTMILEEQRVLHEDLERLEQAIADRMLEEPKNVRTPLPNSCYLNDRLTNFALGTRSACARSPGREFPLSHRRPVETVDRPLRRQRWRAHEGDTDDIFW